MNNLAFFAGLVVVCMVYLFLPDVVIVEQLSVNRLLCMVISNFKYTVKCIAGN